MLAHDSRFDEEANLVILRITHNSPTIIDLLLGSASIAAGMKIAIDAVLQTSQRLKATKLENEKIELELDKERWDFQQKKIHDSIDIAHKVIETIRPGIDPKLQSTLIQHFLPTFSGIESIKVLEIYVPSPEDRTKEKLLTKESQNEIN
jgi:hypothetical protein